jgi:hypothetical protein
MVESSGQIIDGRPAERVEDQHYRSEPWIISAGDDAAVGSENPYTVLMAVAAADRATRALGGTDVRGESMRRRE